MKFVLLLLRLETLQLDWTGAHSASVKTPVGQWPPAVFRFLPFHVPAAVSLSSLKTAAGQCNSFEFFSHLQFLRQSQER